MNMNYNRKGKLFEKEDTLLQQVESAQHLLTSIISFIEAEAGQVRKVTALSVALEAHRQFAQIDRKLLKFRLEHIFRSSPRKRS
ncbi:hypothetical protein [Paenibacillus sp. FSL R7-0179]|uniref:hypothetical protein n=1 Tax=Paenibacillus sp. FSL R7-0179 TaxID=2921672 RepID=UPI0030F5C604